VRHARHVGPVAFGMHARAPFVRVQEVHLYGEERKLRDAICESGPVMKALGDCSTSFPPVNCGLGGLLAPHVVVRHQGVARKGGCSRSEEEDDRK